MIATKECALKVYNKKRNSIENYIKVIRGRFFHISKVYFGDSFLFIPRIPDHRAHDEDSFFERVCFSYSVDGCLKAVPTGLPPFADVCDKGAVFYVYGIQEITGIDNNIVKEFVPDAVGTEEVWSMEPCRVNFLYCIERLYSKRFDFSYIIGDEELTDDEEVALELKFVL
jgi:hypothetical protein